MRRILCVLAASLGIMALAGPAHAANVFVRIGTSSVGGGFYLVGNTLAQLGQAKMPSVNFTAVTGGGIKNAINLEKSDNELGLLQSSTTSLAREGLEPFKTPLKRLRHVTGLYPMPAHVLINKRSGIKKIADFKDKHIDYGAVGQGVELNVRQFMSVYGLKDADVTVERFGRADTEEAFKTGNAQATVWTTTAPTAIISDLIRTGTVELLNLTPEDIKKLTTAFPHFIPFDIPGGIYEGYPDGVHTVAAVGALMTHEAMPEELIYNITKMIHENTDFLKERLGNYFGSLNLNFALAGQSGVPLHPGAAKYYREKGILK